MEWISVDERLPEIDKFSGTMSKYVLICTADRNIRIGYNERGKIKTLCWQCADESFITHWMPLPEPPKEK